MAYDNLYGQQPQAPGVRVPDIFQMFTAAIGGMQAAQQMRHFEAKLPHELAQMDATAENIKADTRYKTTTVDWQEEMNGRLRRLLNALPEELKRKVFFNLDPDEPAKPRERADDSWANAAGGPEKESGYYTPGLKPRPVRYDNLYGPRGY